MKLTLSNTKKAGINAGEALVGVMLGTVAIQKSPDSIKKFVPGSIIVLSLGAMALLPSNNHAQSIATGSFVVGVMGVKTQLTTPKATDNATAPDGTVKGLTITGKAKSIADMLLPSLPLGNVDLGNVEEMDFSNLMLEGAEEQMYQNEYLGNPDMEYLGMPSDLYVG